MIIPCMKSNTESSPGNNCPCIPCKHQVEKQKVMTHYQQPVDTVGHNRNKLDLSSNYYDRKFESNDVSLKSRGDGNFESNDVSLKSRGDATSTDSVMPIRRPKTSLSSTSRANTNTKSRPIVYSFDNDTFATSSLTEQEQLLEDKRKEQDRINSEIYHANATWKMYHRIMTYRSLHSMHYYDDDDDAKEHSSNDFNNNDGKDVTDFHVPVQASSSLSGDSTCNENDTSESINDSLYFQPFFENFNSVHDMNNSIEYNSLRDDVDDYNFMVFDLDL